MPYKNKEEQREYQRRWIANRRQEWIKSNGPCVDCGSWESLEVDHIDRVTKVTHRVWSWSEARRLEELAKCVVRCEDCHQEKTTLEATNLVHGTHSGYSGKHACRCGDCTAAHAEYQRQFRS